MLRGAVSTDSQSSVGCSPVRLIPSGYVADEDTLPWRACDTA